MPIRQPYIDAASKETEAWLAAKEEYRNNVSPEIVRQLNKHRTKTGKRRIVGRRVGQPPSAFLM